MKITSQPFERPLRPCTGARSVASTNWPSNVFLRKTCPPRNVEAVRLISSENAVFILSDPSRFDPTFLSIFAQAHLIRLVKEALEVDEVEIHFANVTTKSPAIGSGISWHRDFPNAYICPETPQMLRTMI